MCIMFLFFSNQKSVIFHCLRVVNSVCNIKQKIVYEGNSSEQYVDRFDVGLSEICEMWLVK